MSKCKVVAFWCENVCFSLTSSWNKLEKFTFKLSDEIKVLSIELYFDLLLSGLGGSQVKYQEEEAKEEEEEEEKEKDEAQKKKKIKKEKKK